MLRDWSAVEQAANHAGPPPCHSAAVAGQTSARAIAGLERALAGLGLLDDALAVDLRRPQDYFSRLWNTAFRSSDLAAVASMENT
jgi:hypothetical protein